MTEYIDRTAFLDDQRRIYCNGCDRRKGMKNGEVRYVYDIGDAPCRACGIADILDALEDVTAADVVLVRHGHWVWNPNGMDWGLGAWVCSECRAKPETWWEADKKNNPYRCSGGHFCGNCGAIMDKDGDGE